METSIVSGAGISYPKKMYYILAYDTGSMLEIRVNEYLRNGWEVQGGVSLSDSVWAQAMVKIEP
jgi:hypothetical protein